jgi:uncharacterized protein (TIGR03437 family)
MKLAIAALLFANAALAAPTISLGGVANAASFQPVLTRGSLATLVGTDLAAVTASASQFPLPKVLMGVKVTVNAIDAPLLYVSPTQINFQVPFEAPADGTAFVTVTRDGVASVPAPITLALNTPGVFTYLRTNTSRDPVITHADGQLLTPDRPARPDEIVIAYATGIGDLIDAPATGEAAASRPLPTARFNPVITIGGAPVEVLFAGLAPGFAGLVQLNLRLPASFPLGQRLPLVIRYGAAGSTPVDVAVQSSGTTPVPAIEVAPNSVQFGEVTVGQNRGLALTVRNTGSGDLLVQGIGSTDAQFAAQLPSTPLRIEPGGQQSIIVRYLPTAAGPLQASLSISTNDPLRPVVPLPVSGTGLAGIPIGSSIDIVPPAIDFGAVIIGQTVSQGVTIRNTGGLPLTISLITSSVTAFLSMPPTVPIIIPGGSQQIIPLRFTPVIAGSQSATLTIFSNDGSRPTITIALTGSGTAPSTTTPGALEVTPAAVDFGTVSMGQNKQVTMTLRNTGTTQLSVTLGPPASPQFTLTGASTPFGSDARNFTLAAGAQQQIVIGFFPVIPGIQTSTFNISSNDSIRPSIAVALAGTGIGAVAGGATIDVTPATLDFGTVPVGTRRDLTLSVRNAGATPLVVSALTTNNPQFSAFSMQNPFGGTAPGFTVPAGGQQIVFVRFQPSVVGTTNATLTIVSNDVVRGLLPVALSGAGVVP